MNDRKYQVGDLVMYRGYRAEVMYVDPDDHYLTYLVQYQDENFVRKSKWASELRLSKIGLKLREDLDDSIGGVL